MYQLPAGGGTHRKAWARTAHRRRYWRSDSSSARHSSSRRGRLGRVGKGAEERGGWGVETGGEGVGGWGASRASHCSRSNPIQSIQSNPSNPIHPIQSMLPRSLHVCYEQFTMSFSTKPPAQETFLGSIGVFSGSFFSSFVARTLPSSPLPPHPITNASPQPQHRNK